MSEFFRILKLLIYKNLLIWKRQWYVPLIGHLLVPLSMFMMMGLFATEADSRVYPEKIFKKIPREELNNRVYYSNYTLYFAPNNNFTKTLVDQLEGCLVSKRTIDSVIPIGFSTEEELLVYLKNDEYEFSHVAVIFEGDNINESIKHLKYKIRSENLHLSNLYQMYSDLMFYYGGNRVMQLQICLDQTFIKMKTKSEFLSDIFVQRRPYPSHRRSNNDVEQLGAAICVLVVIAFMTPLVIETSKVVREKLSGVNVLMSMNGVSTTLTLLSWLITGWIFISILCVVPFICSITISTSDYRPPILTYGDAVIVWLVVEIYTIHLLAYGMHACQYFSKYIVFVLCFLILNVAPVILENFAFSDDSRFIGPYLGIFFPNILLYRAMSELVYYESTQEGIQWKNLFTVGKSSYEVGGSIGMIIILSIIGIIFNFVMAIYINAINPGKYGTKKHPLFFLKNNNVSSDQNNLENVEFDEMDSKYFESAPGNIYSSGIQIRNLKKIYNIGLINKKKIEALRGVSIDFYKGQITSLLGHNGAGKTTMMSILTGMTSPSDGTVIINSKNIKDFQTEVMNDMGLCPQENMFFTNLTVEEQFTFFAKLKGKDKTSAEITQTIKMVLEKLRLQDKRNALSNKLSGGQKRRLCFGMAIVGNPSTLILDEPTSGLDPESRRVIWDILLKMRGQKTILISTHDMEEADVLGDRIAIIHRGKLKSYGTPMFMKKLLGQGNIEVTLSVETGFSIEKIRNALNCEMIVLSESSNKIILNIPNSPSAPDSLDNIQQKKRELGITGLSVSIISLEQVFLKITEESRDSTKLPQSITNIGEKLTGFSRGIQIVRGLLRKKFLYTVYNLPIIFSVLFLVFISFLLISLILKFLFIVNRQNEKISVSLDMYKNPITFYKSSDESFGQMYKDIIEEYGGIANDVKNADIINELMQYGKVDYRSYDRRVIAAVELNKSETGPSSVNAIFSNEATFSFPISVNLMNNMFLKTLVDRDHSISMSYQRILDDWMHYSDHSITMLTGYTTAFILSFFLFIAVSLFVIHPRQEASTNVKQLQRMTGASTFSYWGTMFIFDFAVLFLIALSIIGGFLIMNSALDLRMYSETEVELCLLILVLFIINVLPIFYIFSFAKTRVTSTVKILIYLPLIFVVVEVVIIILSLIFGRTVDNNENNFMRKMRKIQKAIFLLIPYISFLQSQIFLHVNAHGNARCRLLLNSFYDVKCQQESDSTDFCCNLDCYDGICKKPVKYFNDDGGINFHGTTIVDVPLEESLIYLCVSPIIYFAILLALDYQLVQKLIARVKKYTIPEYEMDEKVKYEKLVISKKISAINSNHHYSREFLVYELSKRYKNLIAVKDISFSVNARECFGLLGVNGAGKSTTFKMMTGAEIPDHGVMFMDKKSLTDNADYFFSRMGYCPQNDALIKCLNSYDHLRIFARLRGVPENSVESEVKTWIQRLNLSPCASNPCGTYSGGNKRRLNIAIALIGNPDLVLLDEPTTGVDPGARRSLWNVIQDCQASGQAVILTSHSMEECEALCNRLAIMVDGKFVCIGQSEELKQRFGAGYDIRIKLNPEKMQTQLGGIKEHMLQSLTCELIDENMGYLMYHVKTVETTWRTMYDAVNAIKDKYDCIDDFTVLSSTLEQLFLLFARAADRNALLKK